MGHDIMAYCNEEQVAYNRRGAGNPLNQVLYIALGVMDEAYAGCSGNGCELDVTIDQLDAALVILDSKSYGDMNRDRNAADDVFDLLRGAGMEVSFQLHEGEDVTQEKEFMRKCIEALKKSGGESVRVRFA